MFSQLKSNIKDMDISDDIKAKLVSMVSNVETSANGRFEDVQESRDKFKAKNTELLSQLEDEKAKKVPKDSSEEVEKVRAEMQLRYDTDTKKLSDESLEKDSKYKALESTHEDFLYSKDISDSGLMPKFVEETMARKNINDMIKAKTIRGEDGKIYAKDEITGGILRDINNENAPLGLEYVVNEIASTINPMYLAPQGNGGGGGANHNQGNHSGGKSWAEMTGGEKVALFKKDPKQYEQLKNS